MTRTFTSSIARRAQVNLIIGLCGASSSGKTYSALELATGLQSVTGGEIEMIDTEHGRGLFYADKFKFNHTVFEAPFASLDYLAAIQQAAKRSKIIIVDSMSHEHESEGGMCDYQEAELTRLTRGDDSKRQSMQMLAWAKPKAARRKLLQGLTQVDAHLILCFRAKNSSKPGKDANGKNAVIPMGFVPIAGEEFVFESALSMLFYPNSKGVPTWNPELPGERIAVKLPQQFDWLAQQKGPITRKDGTRLAQWAQGGSAPVKPSPPIQPPHNPDTGEVVEGPPVTALDDDLDSPPPDIFDALAWASEAHQHALTLATTDDVTAWWKSPQIEANISALVEKSPAMATQLRAAVSKHRAELRDRA